MGRRYQAIRGTHDILPEDVAAWQRLETAARVTFARYGFREIRTPLFEATELFTRSIGTSTDVVRKEMYTFLAGDESITLRPENTAPVVRAFVEHSLHRTIAQGFPERLYYVGPMFRYERPQKGRQRQFHQIDLEVLGAPEPGADIEVITVAADILDRLGLLDRCVLKLNSLGDPESRVAYRKVLVDYYSKHLAQLSEESRERLNRNPLRILDSKDDGDKRINANAPSFADHLNQASRDFFKAVQDGLGAAGVPFEIDPALVRGLDYYTHTAFEFVTTHIGAQGTVLGGGRYDGLIAELGGPPTAGIGWAGGIERLVMLASEPAALPRPVVLAPLGAAAEAKALGIARTLRKAGIAVEQDYRGNMKRRMQRANKLNARAAVIIGDDELAKGVAQLKDLDSGEQREVALDKLREALKG